MMKSKNKPLAVFDCFVTQIRRKYFVARINDGEHGDEEADFRLCDFTQGHIDLGTRFSWTIYKNRSEFRLDERKWTQKELDIAKKKAKKLQELFMEAK